jgi:hypothetical protein
MEQTAFRAKKIEKARTQQRPVERPADLTLQKVIILLDTADRFPDFGEFAGGRRSSLFAFLLRPHS